MADLKLSAIPDVATSATLADLLYIVQAGTSKQISVPNFMFGLGKVVPHRAIVVGSDSLLVTDMAVYITPPVSGTVLDLPSLASAANRVYDIRNLDTGSRLVTLLPDGADTIEGGASLVLYATESVRIHANATAGSWYVF
jgi:hypothetical protein